MMEKNNGKKQANIQCKTFLVKKRQHWEKLEGKNIKI